MKLTLDRDWFQDGEFDYVLEQLRIGKNDDERLEIYEVEIMVDDTLVTGADIKKELK